MNNLIKREIPNNLSLPRRISRLSALAYNLWWVWNPEGLNLFRAINKRVWDETGHNPVAFLRKVERSQLNAVANDSYYLEMYDRVIKQFDAYMGEKSTWYAKTYTKLNGGEIAYFSFEFGLVVGAAGAGGGDARVRGGRRARGARRGRRAGGGRRPVRWRRAGRTAPRGRGSGARAGRSAREPGRGQPEGDGGAGA